MRPEYLYLLVVGLGIGFILYGVLGLLTNLAGCR